MKIEKKNEFQEKEIDRCVQMTFEKVNAFPK